MQHPLKLRPILNFVFGRIKQVFINFLIRRQKLYFEIFIGFGWLNWVVENIFVHWLVGVNRVDQTVFPIFIWLKIDFFISTLVSHILVSCWYDLWHNDFVFIVTILISGAFLNFFNRKWLYTGRRTILLCKIWILQLVNFFILFNFWIAKVIVPQISWFWVWKIHFYQIFLISDLWRFSINYKF